MDNLVLDEELESADNLAVDERSTLAAAVGQPEQRREQAGDAVQGDRQSSLGIQQKWQGPVVSRRAGEKRKASGFDSPWGEIVEARKQGYLERSD